MGSTHRKDKAFLFDLNGTMIDDMQYHIHAWHRIFNSLGANISLERMKEECYGKNHEVIERILPGRFTYEEKDAMSLAKEREYQKAFRPYLKLLPGLDEFLRDSYEAGIKMAIGSAAIMFNIDFVLDGLNIRNYFQVLVSADDVKKLKERIGAAYREARFQPPEERVVDTQAGRDRRRRQPQGLRAHGRGPRRGHGPSRRAHRG